MPEKSEFTFQNIATSLIAGLAAAVIFAVVARGGFGALLMALVSPLPITIVAFGFGVVHGATSAIVATVLISVMIHPVFGMTYALLVALPAWGAAYAASGAPRGGRDYITNNHAMWGALVPAIVIVIALLTWIVVATLSFGSFDEALSGVRGRLFIVLEELAKRGDWQERIDPKELSGRIANAMPAVVASYALLIHIANVWLGARIAQASGLLNRQWPDIAMELRFPRFVAGLFASGVALSFFEGPSGAIGLVLVSVTGLLLASQGLAVTHVYLRRSKSSALTLAIIYFVLGLFGWPILFFALLGAADMIADFRQRFADKAQAPFGGRK